MDVNFFKPTIFHESANIFTSEAATASAAVAVGSVAAEAAPAPRGGGATAEHAGDVSAPADAEAMAAAAAAATRSTVGRRRVDQRQDCRERMPERSDRGGARLGGVGKRGR